MYDIVYIGRDFMNVKTKTKNAIYISVICSLIYLVVYISRNILSAVSPQMIEGNFFSENTIGTISSVFFFAYAVGQLLNGVLGDLIHSKFMISLGLLVSGVSSIIFPKITGSNIYSYITFGVIGFALSMIYGPMTKTIAENMLHHHAIKSNLSLNFASYFGAPLAGVLALITIWDFTFELSGYILIFMSAFCFIGFTLFEKKKIISYKTNVIIDEEKNGSNSFIRSVKILIDKSIIKFTFVSILTGVIRTTVMFWLPTYLLQYLCFNEEKSTTIYTVISLIISIGSLVAINVYKIFKNSIDKSLLFSFSLAAILFLSAFLIKQATVNILVLVLAIMASNCAATMMWSFYCPSLAYTGLVSSATGYLDFISYMSASIASKLFANAVSNIGWKGLILVWFGLMVLGVIISLPKKKRCEL